MVRCRGSQTLAAGVSRFKAYLNAHEASCKGAVLVIVRPSGQQLFHNVLGHFDEVLARCIEVTPALHVQYNSGLSVDIPLSRTHAKCNLVHRRRLFHTSVSFRRSILCQAGRSARARASKSYWQHHTLHWQCRARYDTWIVCPLCAILQCWHSHCCWVADTI